MTIALESLVDTLMETAQFQVRGHSEKFAMDIFKTLLTSTKQIKYLVIDGDR